jgi:hypothetical protein
LDVGEYQFEYGFVEVRCAIVAAEEGVYSTRIEESFLKKRVDR